jgi:hypothetical protein
MSKKKIISVLLAGVLALLLVVSWANAEAPGLEPLPPYIGIIKNNSGQDVSVPSENSQATLIVPARGWIEFVVWDPQFDLIPYLGGKPFGCQKVIVQPDSVPYMCKNYDFLVEINPTAPRPTKWYYKKYKKRYRKPRAG